MKKAFAFIAILLAVNACTKQETKEEIAICLAPPTELSGNWKIIEMRADPGDGSGKFLPTTSNSLSHLTTGFIQIPALQILTVTGLQRGTPLNYTIPI